MNNPHKNARTCLYSREQFAVRRARGEPCDVIAAAFGVSVRTVGKWLARHAQGAGLSNRSSRPHSNPRAFSAGFEDVIARLRTFRLTALDIAGALGLARSTVAHVLVRHVLVRLGLNRCDRLRPPEPVQRYERARPGDLIHIDIKKLGRFAQTGHRITGHHRRKRSRHLGHDYVHVAIDDHSRLAYAEVLPDEKGLTCARFLARATCWFGQLGVTVRRVMSDNGVGYRAMVFRDAAQALGQRHIRTRPYTPKTNGKAERFIKTLQEQWAYAIPFQSSQQRTNRLPKWLNIYNCERPHGGIAFKPPISRLTRQA
jgi:transposase InsO family protein